MVHLHEFVGYADYWRFMARLSAYMLDSCTHCCIGNMTEIPLYPKIDSVGNGAGRGATSKVDLFRDGVSYRFHAPGSALPYRLENSHIFLNPYHVHI